VDEKQEVSDISRLVNKLNMKHETQLKKTKKKP